MNEDSTQESKFNFPPWFREPNSTTLNLFVGRDPEECRQKVIKSRFALPPFLDERDEAKRKELDRFAYDTTDLEVDRARAIAQALPRVTKLRLVLYRVPAIPTVDSVVHLLRHWDAALVELEIYTNFISITNLIREYQREFKLQFLLVAINEHLPVLECLILEFEDKLIHLPVEFLSPWESDEFYETLQQQADTIPQDSPIELTILNRLNRAYLYSEDSASVFVRVLRQCQVGYIAEQDLRIANSITDNFLWNLFTNCPDHALKHLTQANISYMPSMMNPRQLQSLFARMHQLTTLKLTIWQGSDTSFTLADLTKTLEELPQLCFLYLDCFRSNEERTAPLQLKQLPSVRELQLNFVVYEHADIKEPDRFSCVFPELELILVEYLIIECYDCRIGMDEVRAQTPRMPHNQNGDDDQNDLNEEEEYLQDVDTIAAVCLECARALLLRAQLAYAHWIKRGARTVFHFEWPGLGHSGTNPILKYDSRYPEKCPFLLSTDPIDYN